MVTLYLISNINVLELTLIKRVINMKQTPIINSQTSSFKLHGRKCHLSPTIHSANIMYGRVIISLSLITFTSPSIVKWLPNSNFNLAANFKDGKLPCSKQRVVFPETIMGSIILESDIQVTSLILPEDGDIVLANGQINFGEDAADFNCTKGTAYYLDKATSSWAQPDVWSAQRFNEATPDVERIPCFDDIVEFPDNAKYTVLLPESVQTIRGLQIGNLSFTALEFLNTILEQSDQEQQFVLNQFYQTGVLIDENSQCRSRFGCPCQKSPPKIDCSVKFCPPPSCVSPIKPEGYCCKLCGGYITFDIDDGFDMLIIKEVLGEIVDSYGVSLAYHIGLTSGSQQKVQIVVVEKGEYSGASAEVINDISNSVYGHWIKGNQVAQISGAPLSKSGLEGKIFISTLLVVALFIGTVYVYYYKLPFVQLPVLFGTRGELFSRFERRTDSVVSLTRRDSGFGPNFRSAFRNPLYDSRRERVQVTDNVSSFRYLLLVHL